MNAISQEPLISVVIPAFNSFNWIDNAIQSALRQTHRNLEVIVVDDGSEDFTADQVGHFYAGEPRVRLISHDSNRGVSAARNTGIDAAQGEYIAFLDSDDTWKPEKLEKQLKDVSALPAEEQSQVFSFTYWQFLEKGALSIAAMFVDGPPIKTGENLYRVTPRVFTPEELEHGFLTWTLWLGGCSALFAHRDAIHATGSFLTSSGYGEDTEYAIRHIVRGGKIHAVPQYLMHYAAPAEDKLYVGQTEYHRYMLVTYREPIQELWGEEVAQKFAGGLYKDKWNRAGKHPDPEIREELKRDALALLMEDPPAGLGLRNASRSACKRVLLETFGDDEGLHTPESRELKRQLLVPGQS